MNQIFFSPFSDKIYYFQLSEKKIVLSAFRRRSPVGRIDTRTKFSRRRRGKSGSERRYMPVTKKIPHPIYLRFTSFTNLVLLENLLKPNIFSFFESIKKHMKKVWWSGTQVFGWRVLAPNQLSYTNISDARQPMTAPQFRPS